MYGTADENVFINNWTIYIDLDKVKAEMYLKWKTGKWYEEKELISAFWKCIIL